VNAGIRASLCRTTVAVRDKKIMVDLADRISRWISRALRRSAAVITLLALSGSIAYAQGKADFSVAEVRSRYVEAAGERALAAKQEAEAWAAARQIPVRFDDGVRLFEIMRIENNRPVYNVTYNVNAAISTAADLVRNTAPYGLNGAGHTLGVWDGGAVLLTHQEFGGRIHVMDGAASHYHATHVGGTIGAAGIDANALGMAPSVNIDSYEWTSDAAEMASRAASFPGEAGKILLSNHSYGDVSGWVYTSEWSGNWGYHWTPYIPWAGGAEDDNFGQYNSTARAYDEVMYNAPYYLALKAAGNDRNDNPSNGETVYYSMNGGRTWKSKSYNDTADPLGDGVYRSGYDTIPHRGVAKNVLTVGAVDDAVLAGSRSLASAAMAAFSGWGPADDGRIKPDVVANGVSLYSCDDDHNADYATMSGTSMSTPNACGSAGLLVEYFGELFPGQAMRSSTLKGLIIHTADDLGNAGPDYSFGWGLMNTKAAADHLRTYRESPACRMVLEGRLDTNKTSEAFAFTWDGTNSLRVTLAWTDPPGTATTTHDDRTPVLVNDLNLSMTGPGGSPTYLPYVLDVLTPASPAGCGTNVLDNVEQVFVSAPPASGVYTVTVDYAGSLVDGEQWYSLLISGCETNVSAASPSVSSVTPSSGQGEVVLTVQGAGFLLGADVKLMRGGQLSIEATAEQVCTERIVCRIDVTGIAPGPWDLIVTNPDGKEVTVDDAFTVPTEPTVMYSTDFAGGLPAGWSIVDGYSDGKTWTSLNPGARSHTCWSGTFMIVDSDWAGFVDMDEELITHEIDCSGYESIRLSFSHCYNSWSGDETGDVDVRVGGGAWQNVARYHGDDSSGVHEIDLSTIADGESEVRIRWRYYGANYDWYWGVDDVEITGESTSWTNTHIILASAGAGGSIMPSGPVTVVHGGSTNFLVEADTNYHIVSVTNSSGQYLAGGPYADNSLKATNVVVSNVTNDFTLTASFGVDRFALSVLSALDQVCPAAGTYTNDYDTLLVCSVTNPVVLVGVEATQYVCTGWILTGQTDTNGLNSGSTYTMALCQTNNAVLTWQWQTNYWLDTEASLHGSVMPGDQWVCSDSNVALVATPSSNCYFTGWVGSGTNSIIVGDVNSPTVTVAVTGPVSLTGTFHMLEHTLEIVSAHGVANPSPGIYTNAHGAVLSNSVTSIEIEGGTQYVCTGWAMAGNEPSGGSTNEMTMVHANDATLTWLWATNYWLDTETGIGGSVGPVDGWHEAGGAVAITAIPSNGYHSLHWTGDVPVGAETNNRLSVVMNGAKSLTGVFEINLYDIVATAGPGGSVSPSGTVSVAHGSSTSVVVQAQTSHFIWDVLVDGSSVGCEFTQGSNSYVHSFIAVDGPHTISATFETNAAASHGAAGYFAPGTNTIWSAFTYSTNRDLVSLLWRPSLPDGWTLGSVAGDGNPSVGPGGEIEWSSSLPSNNPVSFSYQVIVPSGESGTKELAASAEYWLAGWGKESSVEVAPDPLVLAQLHRLDVVSAHGGTVPDTGMHTYTTGVEITCMVTNSPVPDGAGTQYVCTAGAVVGNAFTQVSPTNVTLTLTNDATLTWQWGTNYWLDTETNGCGTVSVADRWVADGSNVVIEATACEHWHFTGWSGDTNGCAFGSPITVPMTQARRIVANFDVEWIDVRITDVWRSGSNIVVEWASSNGWSYMCESAENLADDPIVWSNVSTGWLLATGASMTETDTNAWSRMKRFYRVNVKP